MSCATLTTVVAASVLALGLATPLTAQPQRPAAAGPPPVPRQAAPIDLTGYWGYASLVSCGRPNFLWVPAVDEPTIITPSMELEMCRTMTSVASDCSTGMKYG